MSNTEALQYADRDHIALGQHYTRHVEAMTAEGLHRKSDIAAELAWRDAEIERLRALAQPSASGEPVALWHLSGDGYAPVTKEQSHPPEPLTWDEAIKIGWRPFYATAQPAPALVPPGWALVPVEPTPEMLAVNVDPGEYVSIEAARILWRAMLASAPDAQKGAP